MAEPEQVTDEQALAWLKQLQFEWRSLNRVEKIFLAIQDGRKFIDGMEKQKTAIENDIKAGETRLQTLTDETRKQGTLLSHAKDETNTAKAQLKAEIVALEKDRDRARLEFEQLKAKVASDRADMEALTQKKAAEYTALQKAFDSFKREHAI